MVGAGAAGLTLGYHLCKAGLPVTLLEKEAQVGGLARSFRYDEWSFDIGPHRFYSANPKVKNFLTDILGSGFITIPRSSAVHFMGKYHEWPLRLETIFKLPPWVAARAGLDMIRKVRIAEAPSFENYILRKYGRTLYQTFFKDYTEKFLGVDAARTHRDWARTGVERATIDEKTDTASLLSIFKLMLLPKPAELHFWYPPRGVHTFWEKCAEKIRGMGGELYTGTAPSRLETRGDRVTHVVVGDRAIPVAALVWSGPIPELCRLLGLEEPALEYRSHVLYNVLLKEPPNHTWQWIYYGAPEISFSRISNPATFSPETVPRGRGGLCVELTCQEGDELWRDPERVRRQVVADLVKVRAIRSEKQIEAIKIERVPKSYPIYHIDYPQRLQAARRAIKQFTNVRLLGRTGKFWYNNMDHSIEDAFTRASELLGVVEPPTERARGVLEELRREHSMPIPQPVRA